MSPRNAERIALVTGSNRGIGLEAARQLTRRGFHAVIASRDEGKGRPAAEGIHCLSKLALNGLTIMLAEALRADRIAVNSMCPGWVRTDMGGPNATLSVEEGADTAVWLADEAPHELTGKFFRNRREIPW